MNSNYCGMIHGGLNLVLKDAEPWIQSCCLRTDYVPIEIDQKFWQLQPLQQLRLTNQMNQWDPGCFNCESLENSGLQSFRQGMNQGLKTKPGMSGPARIDLMFDISCNLACRTCGPEHSTYWQRHLKSLGQWHKAIFTPRKKDQVIKALSQINLDNLQQVVFCGGETLLGQEYWDVAQWLAQQVPNAKQQLTLCFQTNGTQPILEHNHEVIKSVHLVKLHVSIDSTDQQFEYLRWPATWQDTTANLQALRQTVPSNVMFLIEQTVSVFNVLDLGRVDQWVQSDFAMNREGDAVEVTRHLANGIFGLQNLSEGLRDTLVNRGLGNFVHPDWQQHDRDIQRMCAEILRFDHYRQQNIADIFPEMWQHYSRFIN